ncbi:VOC family protein [Amycolatopsis pigmentata]|uniref:VOC family protein n=1 Tax=Amycolatopsis pigmentata TaxID=450801 RepID=A0ABW5FN92_9PSEU
MRLHHVNMVSSDVEGLNDFYQTALGLDAIPQLPAIHVEGYTDNSAGEVKIPARFLSAGDPELLQLHLCAPDEGLSERLRQPVNPLTRGHFAFRCDDIEVAKKRLEDAGIEYADYGVWAVKNWYQIFFVDPIGNVVEIHQVLPDDPGQD